MISTASAQHQHQHHSTSVIPTWVQNQQRKTFTLPAKVSSGGMASIYELLGLPQHTIRDYLLKVKSDQTYLAPSDEPLSWDKKNKLVTLDVAIMACHLMVARTGLGKIRDIIQVAIDEAESRATNWALEKATKTLIGALQLTAKAFTAVNKWRGFFGAEAQQRQREEAIRFASLTSQREIFASRLFAGNGGRRRWRDVSSRIKTPSKRSQKARRA